MVNFQAIKRNLKQLSWSILMMITNTHWLQVKNVTEPENTEIND